MMTFLFWWVVGSKSTSTYSFPVPLFSLAKYCTFYYSLICGIYVLIRCLKWTSWKVQSFVCIPFSDVRLKAVRKIYTLVLTLVRR